MVSRKRSKRESRGFGTPPVLLELEDGLFWCGKSGLDQSFRFGEGTAVLGRDLRIRASGWAHCAGVENSGSDGQMDVYCSVTVWSAGWCSRGQA